MRWWLALAWALVLLVPGRAFALGLPELAARTKPSVVLLTVQDGSGKKLGTGTGFFVSEDGRVVTNFHVIHGSEKVKATLSDGREITILGALAFDPKRDIAILQAQPQAAGTFVPLALGDSSGLRPGDEVVVVGSPLGLSGTVTAGIVSAVRDKGPDEHDPAQKRPLADDEVVTTAWGIQITAAISPGSSGSPIMTPAGDVVAVAVGTRLDGQAVNFGVPIEVVKELLRGIDPHGTLKPIAVVASESAKEGPPPGEITGNLKISLGLLVGVFVIYFVVRRVATMNARRVAAAHARRRR